MEKHGVDSYYKTEGFLELSSSRRFAKWADLFPDTIVLINITANEKKQQQYENPNLEIEFKCVTCDTIEKIPSETVKWRNINAGTPCATCAGLKQGSLKQIKIANFIKSLNVEILLNFKLNNNKQIDIFCPLLNIGFEFDGLYWHNDLKKDKTYHIAKTAAAESQGLTLIHIFEDEWEHHKHVVESNIKTILGVVGDCVFLKIEK